MLTMTDSRRLPGAGSIYFVTRKQKWVAAFGHRREGLHYRCSADRRVCEEWLKAQIGNALERSDIYPAPPRRRLPGGRVKPSVRFAVLERDHFRCHWCGRDVADGAKITIDHVVPVMDGGSDSPDNLVAACSECNYGRGHITLRLA